MNKSLALLQTDIVESTRLNKELGDDVMSRLWEAHDRTARTLLNKYQGREVDKTDGLFALFDTAADAVEYAFEYHRSLAEIDARFKARIGIHVGDVDCRISTAEAIAAGVKPIDVTGIAVPTVARVMSMAGGGQTLVTADAKAGLARTVYRIKDHGHWRLKGFEEPINVFQVVDESSIFTPPADTPKCYRVARLRDLWIPVREIRHTLPAERDEFVGRHVALADLWQRFNDGARLVSVLGIGGTGKTRFVQRYAWSWLGEYAGGAWFCDLSDARDLDGIARAVALGLDVPLGKADPIEQIGNAIAGHGQCLVILDNFEQIVQYGEETIGGWLERAPQAQFIVTSREVLNISGEETFSLPPMTVTESAALFRRRAAAARVGVSAASRDDSAVESLVGLLDGLPLAIELAAARVRIMPPALLLRRIGERFQLLGSVGRRRDRQATLRAAFDWSWDLLSDAEKAALLQLSVFEGGVGLAAAEAVLSSIGPLPAVDILQSLVEKSLIQQIGDARFDLLGTIKEYASEQMRTRDRLSASGLAAETVMQERHWRYYGSLSESEAVADRCIDVHNLLSACRRATRHGDVTSAVGALAAAWAALKITGPFRTAIDLCASLRAVPDLSPAFSAVIDWVEGSSLSLIGSVAHAEQVLRRGLSLAVDAGDIFFEARLRCAIGDLLGSLGQAEEARRQLERALLISNDLRAPALQFAVLNALGALYGDLGNSQQASDCYSRALGLAVETQDLRWEGGLLGNLGSIAYSRGRLDEARRYFERALQLAEKTGDRRWGGNAHCNLGLLHHEQGRDAEARRELEAALAIAREIGHVRLESTVLCNLGIVAEAEGDLEVAQARFEEAISLARMLSDSRSEGQYCAYLASVLAAMGRFKHARAWLASARAILATVSDPITCATLLVAEAKAQISEGQLGDAARTVTEIKAQLANADEHSFEIHAALEKLQQRVNDLRAGD